MIIDINKKQSFLSIKKDPQLLKLQYLQINDDNSILKHSLQMSIELYNKGQNSFTHI